MAAQLRLRLAIIVLLASASALLSHGEDAHKSRPEIRPAIAHLSWTQRDGAPGHIAALAKTTDGYLWIGSSLGLYRFDGVQFAAYPVTRLETPLPFSDVESLAADQRGGLWIGFRLGGISHLSRDGLVTNYNRRNGRGPGEVQKLICRGDGSIWALGDGKLMVLQSEQWHDFGVDHGLPPDELYTFYFDRTGNLWTSSREKVFLLKKTETRFAPYAMKSFAVVDFAEMPDGQLWVSDAWHSVHPIDVDAPSAAIATRGLARIAVEPSGTIWMAQDYRGVSLASPSQPSDVVKESSVSEQTDAILRDGDGDIWVGSALGLDCFQPTKLQSFEGLRLEFYPSLAADPQGGVWVAAHEHPLFHISSGDPVPTGDRVGSSPIVCDEQGRVWLVDPILHDLVQYTQSGIFRTPNPAETNLMIAQSIGLDTDGNPLVDFLTKGVWRYDGTWHRLSDPLLPQDDALSIYRDPGHRVWLGFADGQIIMRDENGFHAFRPGRHANVGNVLTFASLQGRTWAGGTDGVAYFDGSTFHKIALRSRDALRGVSGVVGDQAGDIWLNAQAGIVRIDAGQVQKALAHSDTPLTFEVLDARNGVAGSATQLKPTPSAVAEIDGTLVFSTDGNVFFLDPAQVSFRRVAPAPVIEMVSVNGSAVVDREHPAAQITMNARALTALEIDYRGLDLTSPERVTYRYLLEGEDTVWQDAGSRGFASYRHLRPGKYRFRFAAASAEDSVSELSTPLLLTVTPAFYQTKWFYAMCAILVLGLLYLAYLLRIQQVTSRLRERLGERSAERVRIARELHDTLLQSIHALILRFHFAMEGLPEDEPSKESLRIALSRADEVILEGRRRVQDLRDEVLDSVDFASQIAVMASELKIQNVMKFSVTETGNSRNLTSDVQNELCMVAREALANMLSHSRAKSAEIALTYGEHEFMMKCCDDGIGLEPSVLSRGKRDGHWGLVGMRERMSTIQGKFQLWSSPGCGTEVEIRIAGRTAYQDSRSRLKWYQRLVPFRRDAYGNLHAR